MNINVEFLSLPNVAKMVGGKTLALDFKGTTVEDLVHAIGEKYGTKVQQFLLDETGNLDMSFAVTINKQEWIRRDRMNRVLCDGDQVTIMLLAGGG
jgi:sulfur carrier protein ThiS